MPLPADHQATALLVTGLGSWGRRDDIPGIGCALVLDAPVTGGHHGTSAADLAACGTTTATAFAVFQTGGADDDCDRPAFVPADIDEAFFPVDGGGAKGAAADWTGINQVIVHLATSGADSLWETMDTLPVHTTSHDIGVSVILHRIEAFDRRAPAPVGLRTGFARSRLKAEESAS